MALAVSLVVSTAGHAFLTGLRLPSSVEVRDYQGEATIPIDILEQGEPPPEEPVAPPAAQPRADEAEKGSNAGADAGVVRDAALDAESLEASRDAYETDGTDGEPSDAVRDALVDSAQAEGATPQHLTEAGSGATEGGTKDAGEGVSEGGSDPEAVIASSDAVQADVVYVTLLINAFEIRQNPAAAQLGSILSAIPQWNDFMQGTEGLVDPVRDTDWILISGPSLRDTREDAITVHYNISDYTAERAIQIVARRYARGGVYKTGVPGVHAWLIRADNAERVVVRPRAHLLTIVPPGSAASVAKRLAHTKDKGKNIMPGIAAWGRLVDPHHALPTLIPEGIVEMRLKVAPREDLGADITIEGDCKDAATASHAAEVVARVIREHNTFAISIGTHGLLNGPDISSEGKKMVVRLTATREQIEATVASLQFILPGAVAPATSSTPAASTRVR